MRNRHPVAQDRVRAVLAHVSFPHLFAAFVATVVSLALGLGALLAVTRQRGEPASIFFWWQQAFMALVGVPLEAISGSGGDTARQLVQAVTAFGALAVPAVFLGAVVFKLFVAPNVFVFRNKLAVLPASYDQDRLAQSDYFMAIRTYSATPLRLIDVEARVISRSRAPRSGQTSMVVTNRELRIVNPRFPVVETHWPNTIWLPLDASDVVVTNGAPRLAALQSVKVDREHELTVLLKGYIPTLANDFAEVHSYRTESVAEFRGFGEVDVEAGVRARKWGGWRAFE